MSTIAGKATVPFEGDFSALATGAASAVSGIGKSFTSGVMGPVAIVGAVLVGAGLAAVDMASKFATSTDLMAANANITIKQAQAIGAAFLATGGQTTYTAQQMMEAFAPVAGQLALTAGHALSAAQATTFMTAAMNLAEATGQPLASVVSGLAQVMQAYGIQVSGASHATDILENVSRGLAMPVDAVTSAVDKLHAKLGPLAPSLTDVGTLLLDVASHGLTGSRALMLVSTGFTTLLSGSKPVTAELKTLDVTVFDANGKFVGMQSVITQLAPKLAAMTEQQRLMAEKTLFGAGASKALDDTIMAGLPGWNKAAAAVNQTGSAQDAAAKATANFGGMFDKLKSRVVDAAISFGQVLLPAITTVMGWVVAHADTIGAVFTTIGTIIKNIAVTAFTVIFNIATTITTAISAMQPFIAAVVERIAVLFTIWWGIISTTVKVAIGVISAVISALSGPIGVIIAIVKGIFTAAFTVFNAVVVPIVSGIARAIAALAGPIGVVIGWISGALTLAFNTVKGIASTVFGAISGVISAVATPISAIVNWINNTLASAFHNISAVAGPVFGAVAGFINALLGPIKAVIGGVQSILNLFGSVGKSVGGGLVDQWLKTNPGKPLPAGLQNLAHAEGVPGYASGIDYVPATGLAMLHQGEAVIPASRAAAPTAAGVTQHNTFILNGTDEAMLAKMQSLLTQNNTTIARLVYARAGR